MNTWRHTNDLTRLTSAVTTDLFLIRYDNMTPVIPDTFILIHLAASYLATSSSSPLYVRVFPPLLTDKHVFTELLLPHGPHPGYHPHLHLHSASWFSPWQTHAHATSRFSPWEPTKGFTQYLLGFTVLNLSQLESLLLQGLRQVHLSLSAAPRLRLWLLSAMNATASTPRSLL